MASEPTTLQEAVIYFADPDNRIAYLVARRWPDGVTCPNCGSSKVSYLGNLRRWQCASHHKQRQFTLKTGTVMEDSALGLDKWMVALWLGLNCKNGISSYEVSRAIGVSQKSAWHMMHRVRFALHGAPSGKLSGHVEADETFIGGKARNMHIAQRRRRITGTGGKDKTAVMGIMERGGKVRTVVIPNRKKHAIHSEVKKHVRRGPRSTPISFSRTKGLRVSTRTRSSIMRSSTSMASPTPTRSKITGRYSSGPSAEPTFRLSLTISSATSTNRRSGSTNEP